MRQPPRLIKSFDMLSIFGVMFTQIRRAQPPSLSASAKT